MRRFVWIVLFFVSTSYAGPASWDGQEGHGGDGVVAEFRLILADVVREMRNVPANLWPSEEYIQRLSALSHEVQIESREELFLNGRPVDAINYPKNRIPLIHLSKKGWQVLNGLGRHLLVVHETLPLLGVDDSTYGYSIPLIRSLSELHGGHLDVYGSLVRMIERCDPSEFNRLLYVQSLNEESISTLLEASFNSNCAPVLKSLLCNEFDLKDLKVRGKPFIFYIVQKLVQSDKNSYETKKEFLSKILNWGLPLNEPAEIPEISERPIRIVRYLASVTNASLFDRTRELYLTLKQDEQKLWIEEEDVRISEKNLNYPLSFVLRQN